MLNYIAIIMTSYLGDRARCGNAAAAYPQSARLVQEAWMPRILPPTPPPIGILVALALAVVMYVSCFAAPRAHALRVSASAGRRALCRDQRSQEHHAVDLPERSMAGLARCLRDRRRHPAALSVDLSGLRPSKGSPSLFSQTTIRSERSSRASCFAILRRRLRAHADHGAGASGSRWLVIQGIVISRSWIWRVRDSVRCAFRIGWDPWKM